MWVTGSDVPNKHLTVNNNASKSNKHLKDKFHSLLKRRNVNGTK